MSTTWWRHQMEAFSALLVLCAGNSPVIGEFPAQRPVTRSFDDFFDLRLNKRLSQQSWGWWFEKPSRSLWLHCNEIWPVGVNEGGHFTRILECPDGSVVSLTWPWPLVSWWWSQLPFEQTSSRNPTSWYPRVQYTEYPHWWWSDYSAWI